MYLATVATREYRKPLRMPPWNYLFLYSKRNHARTRRLLLRCPVGSSVAARTHPDFSRDRVGHSVT